ncbi:hypothetical protein KGF54_001023 [Candida jiufengensis]|uniref:uncharacterized protein n=1 Tax=Candida jiufengensis TaxID=497108 RepID=UPI0022242690|nr:uncharacterized protein KGF54_001023 [Candida jiufengensis]KAI5956548.1 hypothetical protein KGF54_001023 [Candida jiufengensis]
MSTIQQTFNPEFTQSGEKRVRVKLACDFCKKRKSKCNGENPCQKCADKNRQCVYTLVQKPRKKRETKPNNTTTTNISNGDRINTKKPAPAKVTKKDKTVTELNSRINALESLINNIVSNLDPSARSGVLSQINNRNSHESSLSFSSEHGNSSDEIEEDEALEEVQEVFEDVEETDLDTDLFGYESNNVKDVIKDPKIMKEMLAPSDKTCFTTRMKNRLAQYCGTHSLFFTLSAKSLDWLKNKITGINTNFITDDLYSPLRKMPMILTNAMERSKNELFEKTTIKDGNSIFLQQYEKNLIFEAIELYYNRLSSPTFVCSASTLREIFHKYFQFYNDDVELLKKNISMSEFLIMSSSLVLAFSRFTNATEIDPLLYPNLSLLTTKDAENMRARFFDSTMQYYKFVSVKNEGVKSVQGLALLSLIVNESFISDFHINYGIISSMISYAKEYGIHRAEYINDDDQNYALTCRRVWAFCEMFGVEISYKSGKPMLINYEDVSTLTEADPSIFSIPLDLFANKKYMKNVKKIVEEVKSIGPDSYAGYFSLMLARIKAKSYCKLYSKLPSGISIQGILTVVNEINDNMKKLAELIAPELRPTFEEKSFTANCIPGDVKTAKLYTLEFHFSYFSHLIAINRVPFIKDFKIEDDRLLAYGNTSLKAARKILQLSVDPNILSAVEESSFPFLVFYPMAAYLSLLGNCLVYPNASSSYSDSLLLIQASLRFFAYNGAQGINLDNKRMFCDLMSRIFLRILVDVMEKQASVRFYDIVPELNNHLNSVFNKFPEVFKMTGNDSLELEKLSNENNAIGMYTNENNTNAPTTSSTSSFSSLDTDVRPILSNFMNTYGTSENLNNFEFDNFNDNSNGFESSSKHADLFSNFENLIQQEQQFNDFNFNFNFNNFNDVNDFANSVNFSNGANLNNNL